MPINPHNIYCQLSEAKMAEERVYTDSVEHSRKYFLFQLSGVKLAVLAIAMAIC